MVSKVKGFKNKNKEEFSKLSNLESKLVEDVLKLVKENKPKEIGQKINQNQEYLEILGISNNELIKDDKNRTRVIFWRKNNRFRRWRMYFCTNK